MTISCSKVRNKRLSVSCIEVFIGSPRTPLAPHFFCLYYGSANNVFWEASPATSVDPLEGLRRRFPLLSMAYVEFERPGLPGAEKDIADENVRDRSCGRIQAD